MPLEHVTLVCFLASYLLALVLEVFQLVRAGMWARWGTIALMAAGLVAHTAYLLNRSRDTRLPPLLGSGHDWLLVLAWLAVVLGLAVSLWDRKQAVWLFLLPPVVLMVAAARFVTAARGPLTGEQYWLGMLHVSFLVFGVAGVVVSLVLSGMYLVQHRRMKHKLTGGQEMHLFSLERLSTWNWWTVIVSVPLLTLGMVTGVILAIRSQSTAAPVSLAQTGYAVTGLVWLGMAILFGWLLTSRRPGGRLVAWRTMGACGLLLITLLLLQVLTRGGVHGTGALLPPSPRERASPSLALHSGRGAGGEGQRFSPAPPTPSPQPSPPLASAGEWLSRSWGRGSSDCELKPRTPEVHA